MDIIDNANQEKFTVIRRISSVGILYINAISILLLYYYVAKNAQKKSKKIMRKKGEGLLSDKINETMVEDTNGLNIIGEDIADHNTDYVRQIMLQSGSNILLAELADDENPRIT